MTAVAALWRSGRVRQVLELLSDKAWPQGEQAYSDPNCQTAFHVAVAWGSKEMLRAKAKCGHSASTSAPSSDSSKQTPAESERERDRERERETYHLEVTI